MVLRVREGPVLSGGTLEHSITVVGFVTLQLLYALGAALHLRGDLRFGCGIY